jgi:tetratricopeptide (TPR) repeat protein
MEDPEKRGNACPYPVRGSFAALLDWHLDFGTRPKGHPDRPGKRWGNKEFAHAVGGVSERSVRNWRTGRNLPVDLGTIERELFGDAAPYDQWRFDLRAAFGRTPVPETGHVPLPPAHFLGRANDVATILDVLLTAPSPVSILIQGGPGIGKTSLTTAVAVHPEVVRRFGETNRWFAKLETATTAEAMRDAIMRAIGCDPARGFRAALASLADRPGLLILDNLETPWDPKTERHATEAVLAELGAVPGLALLASFRGRDRVGAPAWALVHPVAELGEAASIDLFRRIAQQQFVDDQHLPKFITALGGIPLAIELVAARAHGRASLATLWREWSRIGTALISHPDFDSDRLTSLPNSIELSLRSSRMTPRALRLFRLLGCLPAGVAAEDRDALLGDAGFDAEEALVRIGLAVDRDGRLDLLPPIRGHAARHHRPEAADMSAWPEHYLVLTRTLGEPIGTLAGAGAMSRLVPEFPNNEAAIRTQLEIGGCEKVMTALEGLGRLTYIGSIPTLVFDEIATACRREQDVLGEANCVRSLGNISLARSDYDGAKQAYERALPLYRQVGDVLGEAKCIRRFGEIALARSDHDGATQAYERALPLYRQVGDVLGEASCSENHGDVALARSDHDGAKQAYERALQLYRQVGDVVGEANCIKSLGDIALARSDHDDATQAYERALPLYRQVGDVLGEANCIQSLGDVALVRSDHERAKQAYERALALYRRIGAVFGEAGCIQSLGDIALARSDHDGAKQAYERALPLYRRIGAVLGEANCVKGLGDIALARSDHDGATQAYERALPLYRQVGSVLGEAACIESLGDIALARSDHDGAKQAYERAQSLYRQVGSVHGEANCIYSLGDIARERSDHDGAKQAYERALPLYRQVGEVVGERNCINRLAGLDGSQMPPAH